MSLESYIKDLRLSDQTAPIDRVRRMSGAKLPDRLDAAVNVGSVLSFVSGVGEQAKADVLFSVQLAQRAADGAWQRAEQTREWYANFTEVLVRVGWVIEQSAFVEQNQQAGDFEMDAAALGAIANIASAAQLGSITQALSALKGLSDRDGAITLLDYHAVAQSSGNFQIGAVQKGEDGALSMAFGAFYFRSNTQRTKFLFARWGRNEIKFWTSAQKMTLNTAIYAQVRARVEEKLGTKALDYIARINLS